MVLDAPVFHDGRGRLPDRLTVAVPRGFRHAVQKAATAAGTSAAALVREAIEAHVDRLEQGGRARG